MTPNLADELAALDAAASPEWVTWTIGGIKCIGKAPHYHLMNADAELAVYLRNHTDTFKAAMRVVEAAREWNEWVVNEVYHGYPTTFDKLHPAEANLRAALSDPALVVGK